MHTLKIKSLLILALFCSIVAGASAKEMLAGRVIGVHDGDTVTLLMEDNQQIKVRLAQIDAPEINQEFGQESKQSLRNMVFECDVRVEKETIDKYGRTVGMIYVGDINVNKAQVSQGMAWAYRQFVHDQSLIQDEENAHLSHMGLWANQDPVAPWSYRHNQN